jgi:hypothetical protein
MKHYGSDETRSLCNTQMSPIPIKVTHPESSEMNVVSQRSERGV